MNKDLREALLGSPEQQGEVFKEVAALDAAERRDLLLAAQRLTDMISAIRRWNGEHP